MASAVSFQGLSSGLQTDSLVDAIIEQASQSLYRVQAKQTNNTKREALLQTLSTDLSDLSTSITTLNNTAFQGRTVTNSDATNQYVSATASGATNGSYEVSVQQMATKAQYISASSVSSTSDSLGGTADSSGNYTYSITDSNGVTQNFSLSASENTLKGLQDAINANTYSTTNTSGLAVTANIIQTAASGGSYKLVLSAVNSGQGSAGNTFTITGNGSVDASGNTSNALGIGASTYTSSTAKNALFTVDGISMERASNTISDVVEGVTFTLNSDASPTTKSTLSIAPDKAGITTALQDVVTKFNAAYKLYKDNSGQGTPTTDASGNTVAGTPGALYQDTSLRSIIAKMRSSIMSIPTGLSSDSTFKSAADLGLATQKDGTLSLNTTVAQIFQLAGASANSVIHDVTLPGSGDIAQSISAIDTQNLSLAKQIVAMTQQLADKRTTLQSQFARMESVVGQLKATESSLNSLSTSSSSSSA